MDITAQEAFKLGFLTRCAEEKLTGIALESRLEKVAQFNKRADGWTEYTPAKWGLPGAGAAGAVAKPLLGWAQAAYAIPFAAAITGGAGLGYGAAKMLEPQISDDEIKAQELADTYRLYAAKAKARKKTRQYRLGHNAS
jgi:hypothetical protein